MDRDAVSPALAHRLGPEPTAGLIELCNTVERNCVDTAVAGFVERFERRLTEEVSALRIDMVQGHAALRQETAELKGVIRQEMASQKFDLLKWSFLFWIGQVVAVGGIVAMLFRTMER